MFRNLLIASTFVFTLADAFVFGLLVGSWGSIHFAAMMPSVPSYRYGTPPSHPFPHSGAWIPCNAVTAATCPIQA